MKTLSIVFLLALMLLSVASGLKKKLRKSEVIISEQIESSQAPQPTVQQMEDESDLNTDSEKTQAKYPPSLRLNSTSAEVDAQVEYLNHLENKTNDALTDFNRRVKRMARHLLVNFRSLAGRRMTVNDFLNVLTTLEKRGKPTISAGKVWGDLEKYGYKKETELRTRNFAHIFRKFYYSFWVAQTQVGSNDGKFFKRLLTNTAANFLKLAK
jgi:hypothetical protein